ncbi:variant 3 [Lathyrus oleraceus]|uniref:Variant 3 n=1 Tax=Pisum sativum TaxID=3888 RepID=A0A9D4Y607_PEA|nr:variant 3 [Pisum sativum]
MASILSFTVASLSLPKSQSQDPESSCSGKSGSCCFPLSLERRKMILSSVAVIAGSFCKGGISLASEFADMPALRGKDYGKTKMRYPDYVETESGLQYKVM